MNWVDTTILVIVLASVLMGFFWGVIRQAVTFIGLWGGLFVAGRIYQPIAEFLHPKNGGGLVAEAGWARIIAFAAVVILFTILLGIVGSLLRKVLNAFFLGWLDHVLGGLVGLITSLTFVTVLLVVVTVFPVPNVSEAIKDSVLAQWLGGFTPLVVAMLPPEFATFRAMMGWGPL